MKTMKKVLALVLAVVLTMGLCTSVFAADPAYSITVKNDNNAISINGTTYSAYKLFDLTRGANDAYSYTISSDSKFYTDSSAKAVIEKYFTLTETSTTGVYNVAAKDNMNVRAFADEIQAYLTGKDAIASAAAANEQAVITLSTDGYYIVTGTAAPTETGSTGTVTAAVAISNANPNPEVSVKADVPTIDKFIVNADSANGNKGLGTAQDVGSVVDFVSESKVPDMTGYKTYKFVIHDSMSAGLTFINDDDHPLTLTIGGKTVTDFTLTTSGLTDDCDFEVTIADMTKYTKGAAVVLTYSAVINEAALNTSVETNEIKLEYSNNPYGTGTGETPKHIVYVYDFDIVIDKFATINDAKTALENAKFVLLNAENKYYKWNETAKKVEWVETVADATEVVTTKDGWAHFEGLDVGTYALHETEAPDGYNLLTNDVEVVISASYKADGTLDKSSATLNTAGTKYEQTKEVENKSGAELPETGGIGTTIFYVLGATLLAAAAVLLITKKRMSVEG